MSKKYVIDACALINASKNYNMTKKAFSHIWQAFNDLVAKDERVEKVILPLRDGLTIIRKK